MQQLLYIMAEFTFSITMSEEKEIYCSCYSLLDGTELWRRGYAVDIKRNHGMSRTIPAVNDKYVVTVGPRCQVMCCDAITGDLLWGIDMVREFQCS